MCQATTTTTIEEKTDHHHESAEIVDQVFPTTVQRIKSSTIAKYQTFDVKNNNLKLKESHTRRALKYARKRLNKMDWHHLYENDTYCYNGEEYKYQHFPTSKTQQVPSLLHAQIELGDMLGEGSFSSVYIAKKHHHDHHRDHHHEDEDIVVKVLRKKLIHNPAMFAACAADLVKEGILLSLLQGESNILQIKGWQKNGLFAYENGHHDAFFLLLERLEYTLSDKLHEWNKRKNKLNNPFNGLTQKRLTKTNQKLHLLQERLQVIPQIAKGIANLHKHGIIHRDLKPDNIGYCPMDNQWKLFDLDVARILPTDQCYTEGFVLTKRVGSPRYMSPECAKGEDYNCTTDVYSFALLVHEIVTLDKPYDDVPAELHDEMIFYNQTRPEIHSEWPISLKYFLESAWHKDWKIRPKLLLRGGGEDYDNNMDEILRVMDDFYSYKQHRYMPNKMKKKNNNKANKQVIIPKHIVDMETSFQTQMTTSLRTDMRDVML